MNNNEETLVKKSVDDFLIKDLEALSNNEVKMNIKSLIDSYLAQASIIEKLVGEFTKTRRIIELFLIEHLRRGQSVEELTKDLDNMENVPTNVAIDKKVESVVDKTRVKFRETKHETGDRF
ncbi:MAG: hypothetical protein ABIJ23_02805 [Candidatus Magasanikbacteria bacterium]